MGSPCPRCGNVQPVNWCAECRVRAIAASPFQAQIERARALPTMTLKLVSGAPAPAPCPLPAVECPCPYHQRLRDTLPQDGAGCCIDRSLALVEPPEAPRPTPPGVALWNPTLAIGGPR